MSFQAIMSIFSAISGMGGGGDSSPADTMVEGASWRNESLADLQMNEGSLGVAAEKAGGNVIRNQVSEMRSAAEKALGGAGMEQGAGLEGASADGGTGGMTKTSAMMRGDGASMDQPASTGAAGGPAFNDPTGLSGADQSDPTAAPGASLEQTGKGLLAGMMNDQGKVTVGGQYQNPGEQFQPFADMQPGAGAGAGAEAGQPQYRIGQQQSAAMLPDLQQQAAGQQASGRYSPTGNASGYRPAAGNPFAAREQQQPQFNASQAMGLLSQLIKKDPPNPYEEQRRLKEEEAKRRGQMTRLRAAPQVAGVPAPAYAPRSPVIAGQVPGLPGKPSYA